MKIDITDIKDRDGAVKGYQMDVDGHKTGGGMSLIDILGDIHIKGDISNNQGILTVTADITGQLEAKCYRCLKKIVRPFLINMDVDFEPANSSESLESYKYKGHILDISQAVIDTIYVNIPQRMLCDEKCKGVCVNCGSDLNEKDCKCKEENSKNKSFSVLNDLFKE